MGVPNILSNYNLVALSLSALTYISCRHFWYMSLAEVDHLLSFWVSLGCNLIHSVGIFWTFNARRVS